MQSSLRHPPLLDIQDGAVRIIHDKPVGGKYIHQTAFQFFLRYALFQHSYWVKTPNPFAQDQLIKVPQLLYHELLTIQWDFLRSLGL